MADKKSNRRYFTVRHILRILKQILVLILLVIKIVKEFLDLSF